VGNRFIGGETKIGGPGNHKQAKGKGPRVIYDRPRGGGLKERYRRSCNLGTKGRGPLMIFGEVV